MRDSVSIRLQFRALELTLLWWIMHLPQLPIAFLIQMKRDAFLRRAPRLEPSGTG